MSATLKNIPSRNHYCEFWIDGAEDLQLLPTINSPGRGNLNTVSSAAQGSIAFVTGDATIAYRLSGAGVWSKITLPGSGGGGGGGIVPPAGGGAITFDENGNIVETTGGVGIATDGDIDNLFP